MKTLLTQISLLITFCAFSQTAQIDTFKLKPTGIFAESGSGDLNFPVVRTNNKNLDSILNMNLKNSFSGNEYPEETLDSTLSKWANGQITFLGFEVTYNQNGILSLQINAEGCGANCSSWTDYFNYSLSTGEALAISHFVDTSGAFRNMVYKEREIQFAQHRQDLLDMLSQQDYELDTATFEWAMEHCNTCEASFNLKTFAIYPDEIEIISTCYFPRLIQQLSPVISLGYKKSDIKQFLKADF